MKNVLDLKNHVVIQAKNDIEQICQPLFEFLGTTFFCFQRIYPDGSTTALANNPQWVEHYLDYSYLQNGGFQQHPKLHSSGSILWDQWPENHPYYSGLQDARKNFDLAHGLSIVKPHNNYVDIYHFATSSANEKINDLYMGYMEPIKKFAEYYFMHQAGSFIFKAEQQKVKLLNTDEQFFNTDMAILPLNQNLEKFYDCINTKQIFILGPYGPLHFNKRENECLIEIVKGKTIKQIAKKYDLSPRTVESYVNTVKYKTNCQTKSELVEKVFYYEQNKYSLFEE